MLAMYGFDLLLTCFLKTFLGFNVVLMDKRAMYVFILVQFGLCKVFEYCKSKMFIAILS